MITLIKDHGYNTGIVPGYQGGTPVPTPVRPKPDTSPLPKPPRKP